VAVGFGIKRRTVESLDELHELASSAGFHPQLRLCCQRDKPDPALFLGSGKADSWALELRALGITQVIVDQSLSPIQQRNLSRLWGLEVFDRTELILRIFAMRARSHEGKLQVELARLQHAASRLVRGWTHLERQQGGIGVRGGPGEKQIELDRRMLDTKVKQVKKQLESLTRQRRTQRRSRERSHTFSVSLVGYTNAGKSSLFNSLTKAETYAADQLFATLDTLTRKCYLGAQLSVSISDTVGFIRDLPPQLVAAFQATLDEALRADLLLHVIDAASPDKDEQIEQVNLVLASLELQETPSILVYNKVDLTGVEPRSERGPCGSIKRVFLSAKTGAGLDLLSDAIREAAENKTAAFEALQLSGHLFDHPAYDPISAQTL
jgi:GTPase